MEATRITPSAFVRRGRQLLVGSLAVPLAAALVACGGSNATPHPTPAGPTPGTTPASDAPPATGTFGYQPLWPFTSQQDADRWLHEGAAQGHSPWHADAEATALSFTQNFLGFAEIDRVTTVDNQGAEAWVGVGQALGDGDARTVATIHLARFGTTPDAPWEVVGTRDDVLTLDRPQYGSAVGPEIDAGGTITGVDESLHLQVRQATQDGVLGEHCCVAAGGEARPWSARVAVPTAPQPGAVTLVVWTGGHVAEVERFAVTGLRVEPSSWSR